MLHVCASFIAPCHSPRYHVTYRAVSQPTRYTVNFENNLWTKGCDVIVIINRCIMIDRVGVRACQCVRARAVCDMNAFLLCVCVCVCVLLHWPVGKMWCRGWLWRLALLLKYMYIGLPITFLFYFYKSTFNSLVRLLVKWSFHSNVPHSMPQNTY